MKITNLYEFIKDTLEKYPNSRNSDKRLAWFIWQNQGYITDGCMTLDQFIFAKSFETIRRTRQKVVETHPDLQPTDYRIKDLRDKKRSTKGKQLYQDKLLINETKELLF